jgi:hypothetical protein
MELLTIEQINETLSAKPEFKTQIISSLKNDFLSGIKAEGLVVRTKEEDETFISNYEKNIIPAKVEAEIGQKIKAVHDQYDNDLFELTGERKNGNEKTYDFMKRKIAELKEKVGKGGDQVDKDQLKQLQEKLKAFEGYVAPDEVNKLKEQYFRESINLKLGLSLDKKAIAVPAHITDEKQKQEFASTQREAIKMMFLNRFTAKQNAEGKTVYYEGETLLTNANDASPMTEEQIIAKHFSGYFVPETKPKAGAGSGGNGGGSDVNVEEAELKTKEEVTKYLEKKLGAKGVKVGSAEFSKEYQRILTAYGITQ